MIRAEEAANNVTNYKHQQYLKVAETVNECIEIIGRCIEFNSRAGISSATVIPYTNSRFPSVWDKETAHDIFEKIFVDHGYKVIENSVSRNVLTVQW